MRKLTTLLLLSLFISGCTENNQQKHLLEEVDNLKILNDSLNKVLNEENIFDGDIPTSNYWYNAKYDGEQLISNGIENPEEFIEEQLRSNPEIIPLKAVLGGTMRFGNIQLLSSKWIIANYDDGHIQGKAIFKYSLNNKGQLEFELLSSISP